MADTWKEYGRWYEMILEKMYNVIIPMFDSDEAKDGTTNRKMFDKFSWETVY